MKNLKKVLALALAFVMCFTMFAGAAVYSDVPAGSDYSEAVTLLSDLGVIAGKPDGSYGVNDTITRADAACLIARMMTGETTPSKYAGASNFTDVAKDAYYESSVAYCAIMGITSGTGNGQYSPLRTITDGEFVAMVTRALGYDTAENPLQFPMGNIAVAQQEGLLDDVNCVASSPALRGEDAQIIYNALFADYDRFAKSNNIYQGSDDEHPFTIAEEVFNLARLAVEKNDDADDAYFMTRAKRDSVTCIAHTWVVAGVDARESADTYTAFMIKDKDDELQADEAITFKYTGDVDSILGYQVELWGDVSHSGEDLEVVAIKTVKGQTGYDWNISMGEDGTDALTVGDDKEVDAEEAPIAVINLDDDGIFTDTDADDAYDIADFDDTDWDNKDGDSYRLVDWDSDGDIDFVIKTTRKYAEVTDIDDEDIEFIAVVDQKMDDKNAVTFEIDDDNLKFDCKGIEEDDIVEMTVSRAYDKKEGEVVTITMTKVKSDVKELTEVSTKKDLKLYFDEKNYEFASDAEDWDLVDEALDLDEANLEEKYELWLDANGYIVKAELSDEDEAGYLVILEVEDGVKKLKKSNSTMATAKVKLDNNKVETYDLDFDLDVIGYDDDNYRVNSTKLVGGVYKYWLKDDVITKLERAVSKDDTITSYAQNTGVVTTDTTKVYLKKAKALFVAADKAIKSDGYDWSIDSKDVKAVEPTTANLKKLEMGTAVLVKPDENWGTNHEYDNGDQIAYKVNDDLEAKAALVAIDNYNTFADTTVGMILEVTGNKDTDTVFTLKGAAVNGEVGNFKTDKVDVEDVFFAYEDGDEVELKTLKKVREYIDEAAYAEVTIENDIVTRVVFMEINGNIAYGSNYAVARFVVGRSEEVTDDYLSVISLDDPDGVMYADKYDLCTVDLINYQDSVDLDKDTNLYSISNKVLEQKNGVVMEIANGWSDTPKISTLSKGSEIASSKNTSKATDKYAIADVAFSISSFVKALDTGDLEDVEVEAVFSYAKKLGEVSDDDYEAPEVTTYPIAKEYYAWVGAYSKNINVAFTGQFSSDKNDIGWLSETQAKGLVSAQEKITVKVNGKVVKPDDMEWHDASDAADEAGIDAIDTAGAGFLKLKFNDAQVKAGDKITVSISGVELEARGVDIDENAGLSEIN